MSGYTTKHTPKAKLSDQEVDALAERLMKHGEEMSQESVPTISANAQPEDTITIDAATNNALPNNDKIPETDNVLVNEAGRIKKKSYTLKDYMPKVGMTYFTRKYKKVLLGQKRHYDMEVMQSLWSQQNTGDKKIEQALITQVLNHATLKIQRRSLSRADEEEHSFRRG